MILFWVLYWLKILFFLKHQNSIKSYEAILIKHLSDFPSEIVQFFSSSSRVKIHFTSLCMVNHIIMQNSRYLQIIFYVLLLLLRLFWYHRMWGKLIFQITQDITWKGRITRINEIKMKSWKIVSRILGSFCSQKEYYLP